MIPKLKLILFKKEQSQESNLANLYYAGEVDGGNAANIMSAMSKYLDASKINEDKLNDKIEEKLEFISAYFRWTPGGVTKVGSSFDSNIMPLGVMVRFQITVRQIR